MWMMDVLVEFAVSLAVIRRSPKKVPVDDGCKRRYFGALFTCSARFLVCDHVDDGHAPSSRVPPNFWFAIMWMMGLLVEFAVSPLGIWRFPKKVLHFGVLFTCSANLGL